MQIVTREGWHARPPRDQTRLDRAAQHGTAVHYSAADADEQAAHARCASRVRSIQAYHMDTKQWADIAYSYLVCKHGYVFEGRGRGIRTAAQGTNAGNDAWHAVCFLGDDTAGRDDVTDLGREAIRDAVRHCNAWSNATGVRPHSAFHATGCPGDDLRGWIARGMPVAAPTPPPKKEDDMTTDELHAYLTSDRGQRVLHDAVTYVLRVAVGPDDAKTPAGVYFDRQAVLVDEIHQAVVTPPPPKG
jgi:hypothetical protein